MHKKIWLKEVENQLMSLGWEKQMAEYYASILVEEYYNNGFSTIGSCAGNIWSDVDNVYYEE